jgi:hypothetical protein
MHQLYWRAEENREEEAWANPLSRAADHADRKLDGNRLRRIRARVEAVYQRSVPYRR